jgi:hypothetical protein
VIDWRNVLINSLWIAGLAMALAILSYADWQASVRGGGLRRVMRHVSQSPGFCAGLTLVCVGAGLGVSGWVERLLWFLLAAGTGSRASWIWLRQWRNSRGEQFD